jgi:hypothetical protein
MYKRPIQEVSNEELVTTCNRRHDVTKGHGSTVSISISELATGSHHYAYHVQDECDGVKLKTNMNMSNVLM